MSMRDTILDELVDHPWFDEDCFEFDPDDLSLRYLTIYCYGDILETDTAYPTLAEAEQALSEHSGAWGIVDLDAPSLDEAYLPPVITVRAGMPSALSAMPMPDH